MQAHYNRPMPNTLVKSLGKSHLLLLLIAFLYAADQLLSLPAAPIIEPDSLSYISFYPIRTAGYPIFLKIFTPELSITLQVLVFTASLLYLAIETLKNTGNVLPATALMILINSNAELNSYHSRIMTESLYTSLVMLFLGAMIRFTRSPTWQLGAVIGLIAGITATVRPTAYALAPILAAIPLISGQPGSPKTRAYLLTAVILVMVSVIGIERAYTSNYHGARATSLAGRHFFAKAAMIDVPPVQQPTTTPNSVGQRLAAALEQDFRPVRDAVHGAPDLASRSLMTLVYEVCIEYSCMDPIRNQMDLTHAATDKAILSAGMSRLARAPLEYLNLSLIHYLRLIGKSNPTKYTAYQDYISSQRPLPFEPDVTLLIPKPEALAKTVEGTPKFRPSIAACLTLVLALTGLLFVMTLRRPGRDLGIALLAAFVVHSSFTLTALIGVGEERYAMGQWPAMMTSLVFLFWWAIHIILKHFSRHPVLHFVTQLK